jgi:hypothetical protein
LTEADLEKIGLPLGARTHLSNRSAEPYQPSRWTFARRCGGAHGASQPTQTGQH